MNCDDLIICRICKEIEDYRMMNGVKPKYLHIDENNLRKLRQTIEYEKENFPVKDFNCKKETIFGLNIVIYEDYDNLIVINNEERKLL